MTVLVFGSRNPVARVLAQVDGIYVVGSQIADPLRPADCAQLVDDLKPKAVVNTAVADDLYRLHKHEDEAYQINGAMPTALAEVSARHAVPLIHLSGPDVFDGGLPMPYIPDDAASPVTALGRTRWAGEAGVRQAQGAHAVLRTTWVFEDFAPSNALPGYCRAIAPAGIVAAPTPAGALANAIVTMAGALSKTPEKSGTYHFAGLGDITLEGFASVAALLSGEQANHEWLDQSQIWQTRQLPENQRLDCRTTQAVFGLQRPNWRKALAPRQAVRPARVA